MYPDAAEQRCWNHRILNVLDKLPKRLQTQATRALRQIPYAETGAAAERLRADFAAWCREPGCPDAAATLERDWDRMVTFYRFPRQHWRHLRTTNPLESPCAALRLRADAAKRFKRVDNATAVIWKMLQIAETKFRRLNAPELMNRVYLGGEYVDGIEVTLHQGVAA